MRSLLLLVLLTGVALLAASPVEAEERFPRPEFETDYEQPQAATPPPRAEWREILDIVVLAAAMGLSAFFALKRRSRRGLFGVAVFSVAYFGFLRVGCVCPVGSLQNVAAALADPSYVLPASVIAIFILPLLFSLYFGRVFCGGVCPLGAVQDLVMIKPLIVPRRLAAALGTLPYLYLGLGVMLAATGSVFLICQYDPFVSFFRFGGNTSTMVYSGGFLLLSMLVARPYCRFLCPYGVLLGWMSRLSSRHLRTNPENCVNCRLCEEACAMGCIQEPSTGEVLEDRPQAIKRLAVLVLLLPVVALASGWVFSRSDAVLARFHPTVSLAERIQAENASEVEGTTLASRTFRASGESLTDLIDEALAVRSSFRIGGWWLGVFFGLVIVLKLIALSVYRTREAYQPDPASCFSCGRCFAYCPQDEGRSRIQIRGGGDGA